MTTTHAGTVPIRIEKMDPTFVILDKFKNT